MNTRTLNINQQADFRQYLIQAEKSAVTVDKYLRDVRSFFTYVEECKIESLTKEVILNYKSYLQEQKYAIASINSMLASLNSFLEYMGWQELRVKGLKQQRQIYCTEEKQLTKEEYLSLLKAAGSQSQLNLIMQTICSTGIRISELKYFTVEDVKKGEVQVCCKNKSRIVLIPKKLQTLLIQYSKRREIKEGKIFITKKGNPIDRSNIWTRMKELCKISGVTPSKVFPHNLRKLFARTFYNIEKDIAKLADILGHGSINTTRIYIMSTGMEHRKKIEKLGLIMEEERLWMKQGRVEKRKTT